MKLNRTITVPVTVLAVSALTLAGCTDNTSSKTTTTGTAAAGNAITVTITDTSCEVSPATAPSGVVTFTVTNKGTKPNELEVLAENQLQIASEQENIGPGSTVTMTTALKEGSYWTACKPNMVGKFVGLAEFTVTKGEEVNLTEDEKKAEEAAITNYTAYVKDQVGQLVEATKQFTDAYTSGDEAKAKELFGLARQHYERIEPTAESFGIEEAGDIDGALDARIQDIAADAGKPVTDPEVLAEWTGWHRIEADLFTPAGSAFKFASQEDRQAAADNLNETTQKLYDLVYGKIDTTIDGQTQKFELELSNVVEGASALLEEVSTSKIVGEEDTFSHTDLYDFQGNLEGAQVAYGNIADLVKAKDADLDAEIQKNFKAVEDLLKSVSTGTNADGVLLFPSYADIASVQNDAGEAPDASSYTETQRKFSDAVNALSESLSHVAGTILH